MQTIALVAIVKNERLVLPRLFESCKHLIESACIVDTGSTDGTQDWLMEEAPVPVFLQERPWENFEVNRTQALEAAKGQADWLLLMDADMTVSGDVDHNALEPDLDAYMLQFPGRMSFWVDRLISGSVDWCFKGYAHEYLDRKDGGWVKRRKLRGLDIYHHADGANRKVKYDRSTSALLRDWQDHPERRARTAFYLGNNYRDTRQTDQAIRWYQERVKLGGWAEEVYLSMVELGKLTGDKEWFWRAYCLRPTRREALAHLVPPPNTDDILFVNNTLE